MAYQTGTASDHEDLWNKLLAFLTTDAQLVALNQNWEVAWLADDSNSGNPNDTDIVLRGPGLADQDSIYVALRRVDDVASDLSTIYMRGATGVINSADQYHLHVNVTPNPVKMFLRPNSMDYWFVANGRRFIVVVQIGTVYETLYAGFFLPYADPEVYTYPMFIGGSSGSGGPSEASSWSSVRDDHTAYMFSNYDSNPATGYNPSAWMLGPDGAWLRCSTNTTASNAYIGPSYFGMGLGIGAHIDRDFDSDNYGYNSVDIRQGESYGAGFALTPFTLTQASPQDQTFGALDGVYRITGRGQSIENVIQADNAVHIVFQNTFRTALGNWYAVTLGPEDSNSAFISSEESNS